MAIYNAKEVGEKLKTARKKAKLKQTVLAKMVDISSPMISRFESGTISPTLEQISKLCNVLDITINDLFNDSERLLSKENTRNIFKTDTLYLYYKGINSDKKVKEYVFKIDIIEHEEKIEVKLLRNNIIYMEGYMLSDGINTCDMIFKNYEPNCPKYDIGILTVNISSNINGLMMGVIRGNNEQNTPNDRKCVVSKKEVKFDDKIRNMLKVTDKEKQDFEETDSWYINIRNKQDFEE